MQECVACNYRTNNKVNFKRHLQSQKHRKNQMHGNSEYRCNNCNKIYKFASGLSRHRNSCMVKQTSNVVEMLDNVVKQQQTLTDKLDQLSCQPATTTNNITIKMYMCQVLFYFIYNFFWHKPNTAHVVLNTNVSF